MAVCGDGAAVYLSVEHQFSAVAAAAVFVLLVSTAALPSLTQRLCCCLHCSGRYTHTRAFTLTHIHTQLNTHTTALTCSPHPHTRSSPPLTHTSQHRTSHSHIHALAHTHPQNAHTHTHTLTHPTPYILTHIITRAHTTRPHQMTNTTHTPNTKCFSLSFLNLSLSLSVSQGWLGWSLHRCTCRCSR